MKRSRLAASCLVFFLMICLTACGEKKQDVLLQIPEDQKLVVYTSHKPELYEPIIKEFENRSGIWVEVVTGSTNELLEHLAKDDLTPKADVMFGGGVDSWQNDVSLFMPYTTLQDGNLEAQYQDASRRYTLFSNNPIVFIYNKNMVLDAGAPRKWVQFLDRHFNGQIAFADPEKSGSSYTALVTMAQICKEQGYSPEQSIAAFCNNLKGDLSADSGAVTTDVISGKKQVGIVLEEFALKEIAKGAGIGIVYPRDGTSAVPDGCGIIKGTQHEENAKKFMEFIVSDDVQKLLEERLYRASARCDLTKRTGKNAFVYDLNDASNNRDYYLSVWNQNMPARADTGGAS